MSKRARKPQSLIRARQRRERVERRCHIQDRLRVSAPNIYMANRTDRLKTEPLAIIFPPALNAAKTRIPTIAVPQSEYLCLAS